MSTSPISDHLPDINLITSLAERQTTVFSRISPWTKLGMLICLILTITCVQNILVLLILYVILLFLYRVAELPVRKIIAWQVLPAFFVISLVGILIWNEPGSIILMLPIGPFSLHLTDNGLFLFIRLLLKALISFMASIFFLMTTRYEHFSALIYRLFPTPLDQIFLMAYRFLFLTIAMTGSVLKAVRSRGGGLIRSVRMQSKMFAEVAGLVFIRSFEQAERVEKAMISRGYANGTYRTVIVVPPPTILEYLLLFGAYTLVIVSVWIIPFFIGEYPW
ncbi:energy-coupling factor transporter transmembrane component T family protein [Methanospirillum lacunae]|uniref:Cobalt ABC transporter permease n=1 Tax=Methanospirillum lacunae TaxID=668570 RepID=A0A2V2MZZ7_9EURY|nr:energy-coupling factor transporter transmembrane component T [Methanospirillum lacunae]PWR73049.1 cobalt ABC transporter permease [Methanospirillum lacunae]